MEDKGNYVEEEEGEEVAEVGVLGGKNKKRKKKGRGIGEVGGGDSDCFFFYCY